jgi:hypothetical protein
MTQGEGDPDSQATDVCGLCAEWPAGGQSQSGHISVGISSLSSLLPVALTLILTIYLFLASPISCH